MHAIKLAKAYVKRNKISKLEGHFDGVVELLFVGRSWPLGEAESAGHDPLSAKNSGIGLNRQTASSEA